MRKEKRIAVIDAETDPFKYGRTPKPFAWGFYDGETYLYFWGDDCTEQLALYLQDEEDIIIYAHNGGKFDFFYWLKYLDDEINIINGRIARASINDKKIEFRDSYLILPMPLSEHDKDKIDYNKMEREVREIHKPEILRYLQKDCTSLFDWIKNFRDQFGGGLTLAGSAFKQLKKTDYPYQPTGLNFDNVFRPFYSGGRVQCFEVGAFKEDLIYVDIHSAYPFAMMNKHWLGGDYRETLKLPDQENGSYFVKLDAISKGALAYKDGVKTYYPDDNVVRTYHATGWEIISAIKTDTIQIKKIHRCYLSNFTADFTEYVNKFFAMKQQAEIDRDNCIEKGDDKGALHYNSIRTFAKLMLNSCYGKFGQDGRKFEKFMLLEYGDVPDKYIDPKTGELAEEKMQWQGYAEAEGFISIFNRPDPVERFYNVATAASITGFVRAYLWENICKSEGVLYCDTDSIICNKFGGVISPALGDWGVEAHIKEAYIAQRKMYALLTDKGKHKIACKGVRLNYDQIKNGVETKSNITFAKDSPAFSLKFGARYTEREIDFKNIEKNACNNPPKGDNTRTRAKKPVTTITHSLKTVINL